MGGVNQSSSSGSSQGTSTFNSFPQNFQAPPYGGLPWTVAPALTSMLTNPNGTAGVTNGSGSMYQPSAVYNPDLGYNVNSSNTQFNPLVAGMEPGQQQGLANVNAQQPGTPQGMAGSAAETAVNNAYQSPYGSNAADTAANVGYGGYQPSLNQAYGAGNFANDASFGTGQIAQAGQTAGGIGAAGANPLAAGTGTAMGGGWGRQTAGDAAGSAGGVAAAGQPGLTAAQRSIADGLWGGGAARGATDVAQSGGFGVGSAEQAQRFAGQNQNLQPAGQRLRQEMDPSFAYNQAVNPFTQGVVGAAVNPLIQSFNAQTIPGLQGVFTAAGQRLGAAGTGVGGSSAFDTSGANALTGLGANIGATSASILNPTYQAGLQTQANAPGQFAALQGQKLAGLESAAQTKLATQTGKEQALEGAARTQSAVTGAKTAAEQAQATTAAGIQAQQAGAQSTAAGVQAATSGAKAGAELQAAQTGAGIQAQQAGAQTAVGAAQTGAEAAKAGAMSQAAATSGNITAQEATTLNQASAEQTAADSARIQNLVQAATTSQGISTAQIDSAINTLNANALPQLTKQYGINQGLQLYNQQVNQFLTALGLGGQVSQPVLGNTANSFGQSSGNNRSSSKGAALGF